MTNIIRLPLRHLRVLALIAIGYFIAARIDLLWVARPNGIATIWPASGVALAALLLRERRHWPATLSVIFAVNAASNLLVGDSVLVSLGFALANTLEPAIGAWLLVRLCGSKITFERTSEVIVLLGVATLSNGLTALAGAAVPALFLGAPFFAAWRVWWIADGLGMLLVAPLIVVWVADRRGLKTVPLHRAAEGAILSMLLASLTGLIFGPFTVAEHPILHPYMLFPFVLWAALHFHPRGVTTMHLLIAIIAVWLTAQGYGVFAFADQSVKEYLLSAQIFLGVVALTGLLVSAILTERRSAETALRNSEERLRTFYENTSIGIYRTTPDGQIIMVNPALLNMLGYSSFDELASRNLEKEGYEPTYDRQLFKTQMERDGRMMGQEAQWLCRDGSHIWVNESATAIRDERGNTLYYDGTVENITERKRAEEALRESEQRYRSLFENMLDGFAYCQMLFDDQARPTDFVYLNVNNAFERLTGLNNVVGKRVTEVIPGIKESSPELFEIYARVALTGNPEEFEIDFKPLAIWLSISVYSTQTGYFVAVFDNITERKRAEQKIVQLHRLYIVLSNINQVIVRASDRDILFNEVCRIAVEDGHLRMAWIGLIDDATQHVEPAAAHGQTGGYLNQLHISIADDAHHLGPTATAVRERRIVFCNDIEHDALFAVWRDRALAQGFHSEAVLPLTVEGRVIGTFNLYAAEPYFFDADEIQLLQELAGDLSYACEALEHEARRQRAETEAAWLASFPRMNPSPIVEIDADGRIRYANPAAAALLPDLSTLGVDHPWLRGLSLAQPESPEEPYAIHGRELVLGTEWYWQALSYVPETHSFRVYASNITDLKRAEAALQKHARRLEVLHTIDRSILAAQSVRDTVVKALSYLRQLVDCQQAGVALFDFTAREAQMFAVYTNGPTYWREGDRFPLADELVAVLHAEEVSIFDDLSALPVTAPIRPMLRAEGMRSYAVIRLSIGAQLIGAMNLASHQPGAFHREPIEVAREVATQLAIAVYQAQLHEQIQRHAAELEQRVAERTRELAAANERLTELDRLKSKFVSDVSHELRTPITSLKLYLELLEHGKPEKRPKYLIGLNEQADRMTQLIEDILDLSRLERDKATLIFAPIDLNAVIENVVIGQQARADQAGLALTFDPDPHLPPISGEIHRLTQVVTNLVANAINYTSKGAVHIVSSVTEDNVCFEVRDTGMGIDAADLPHLFERFYRGKRAVQSSVRGTGLGLSIVKDIVELHAGHIEVESRVNAGSTFRVWLPIAR